VRTWTVPVFTPEPLLFQVSKLGCVQQTRETAVCWNRLTPVQRGRADAEPRHTLAELFLVCSMARMRLLDRWSDALQHDQLLRAAARAIYDACYPGEEWAPVSFDEAERYATVHYRQAVGAALAARAVLASRGEQLPLPVFA
jgi:hypothetical protein